MLCCASYFKLSSWCWKCAQALSSMCYMLLETLNTSSGGFINVFSSRANESHRCAKSLSQPFNLPVTRSLMKPLPKLPKFLTVFTSQTVYNTYRTNIKRIKKIVSYTLKVFFSYLFSTHNCQTDSLHKSLC